MLIAFEGGEGTGKSTQVAALAAALHADGFRVRCTFEPGGTPAGQQIRQIVLGSSHALDARAEALLFAADRANHVATVIGPALRAGEVVLTDRFLDSSLAYQGAGRSLSVDEVRDLSRWAIGTLTPDLTVVLDLPVAEGLRRAGKRGSADRLESETLHFHERVRQAFLAYAAAEPDRYAVVDATGSRTSVAAAVRAAVGAVLSRRPASPAREPTAVAPGGGAQRTGDPGEVAT